MKGVVYRESHEQAWRHLLLLQPQVRDYVAVLGLTVVIDEAEGYAFLRRDPTTRTTTTADQAMPRLVARRSLSLPRQLLLALLRKKLAEFDATDSDTRLILTRTQIVDMLRVFLPAPAATRPGWSTRSTPNQQDRRARLPAPGQGRRQLFEVRRILKAFVDGQWLADFDQRLAEYAAELLGDERTTEHDRSAGYRMTRQPASTRRTDGLEHRRVPAATGSRSTTGEPSTTGSGRFDLGGQQRPAHRRHRLGQVDDGRRDHHPVAARQQDLLQQGRRRRDPGTDLRSYVLGHHKSERNEATGASAPVGLRDAAARYSVHPRGLPRRRLRRGSHARPGVLVPGRRTGQPERFFVVAEADWPSLTDFSDFGGDVAALTQAAAQDRAPRRTTTSRDTAGTSAAASASSPSRRWTCSTRPCR